MMKKYNLLLFGSDIISKQLLIPLYSNFKLSIDNSQKIIHNLEVVSHYRSEKTFKQEYPIHEFCQKNELKIYEPLKSKNKDETKLEWRNFENNVLNNGAYNIALICSFGYMIPSYIIDKFSNGMYVIHPSLLPKYRGAAPIYHALLNNDKLAGVSFLEISKKKFDSGSILLQKEIEVNEKWDHKNLALELGNLAGMNAISFLENLEQLKINGKPQTEEGTSKAPKLSQKDTFINWEDETEQTIYNKFRAYKNSSFTSIRTLFEKKVIFLDNVSIASHKEKEKLNKYLNAKPNSIWMLPEGNFKHNFFVRCKDGWINVKEWRFFDKRTMTGLAFTQKYIDKEKMFTESNAVKHIEFEKFSELMEN